MKLKSIVAGVAMLSSTGAFAGVTGNVGAFSEYMFRGIEQSNGVAVQGGLDLGLDIGAYAGTWVSNTKFPGYSVGNVSYETDLYAGYTKKWGDFGVDVGAVYYYYRDDTRLNTIEGYIGALLGPATIKLFYTPEYFGAPDPGSTDPDDRGDGLYLTASAAFPLNATVTLTPQVGYSKGDGVQSFVLSAFEPGPDGVFGTGDEDPDDNYFDYSLTLAKTLDAGFTFSFAVIGTNLEKDDEKLVVGLKKTFDI
ncbi:MAG TPA: TorF family putative porin [Solimonas sp.]|nr:TorF family putative porin [Solimonas sp.]